jgi:L,D-transpeptidase catalytic domain
VPGWPTSTLAWRAQPLASERPLQDVPRSGQAVRSAAHVLDPEVIAWLLVLRIAPGARGRCWIDLRLPWRPDDASGWLPAASLRLQPTRFRIAVSRRARTLTLYRAGKALRSVRVVVGKPATPTPSGMFSIIGAWRSAPNSFLGSWILALTAHSNVLRRFEGGDGTVAIHGRGGASLLDPLGSALSHGCIRLANSAIDWLVREVGEANLAGTPVTVQ